MGWRPEFSIAEFVGARREFDDGRGPAEAWARLNDLSLWRLDELAERAGSRAWAVLVSPPDLQQSDRQDERLVQALRSAQIAAAAFPTFWRFDPLRISISRMVVAQEPGFQRAVRMANRYGQVAVVHVQRIPFEHVAVIDVAAERSIKLGVLEPTLIAQCLARSVGGAGAALVYRCATRGECLAMALAERRLQGGR